METPIPLAFSRLAEPRGTFWHVFGSIDTVSAAIVAPGPPCAISCLSRQVGKCTLWIWFPSKLYSDGRHRQFKFRYRNLADGLRPSDYVADSQTAGMVRRMAIGTISQNTIAPLEPHLESLYPWKVKAMTAMRQK